MTKAGPALAVPCALLAAAVVVAGCESTQDKSARIAASLGPVKQEQGLEIKQESTQVEVLDTTLLTDEFGSAAVVELRNNSDQALAHVPVSLDVLDAKGKSVYNNDIPGLEPALTSMPLIQPGQTAFWVHNQVLATDEPQEAKVVVGEAQPLDGELPEIEVTEPEIKVDPVSGVEADGVVVNNSEETLPEVLFYGVATNGEQVVAAGRGAVEELKAGRRRHYNIFFSGDPMDGELTVTSFVNLETE